MPTTTEGPEPSVSYGELFKGHKDMASTLLAAASTAIARATELRGNSLHMGNVSQGVIKFFEILGFREARFTLAVDAANGYATQVADTLTKLGDTVGADELVRANVISDILMARADGNISVAETILADSRSNALTKDQTEVMVINN